MKHSQRLEVVLELYQRKEDEASAKFRDAQLQRDEQISQLDQLCAYQTDYQRRISTDAQGGISMAQWKRTQDYVDQLHGLIRQQEHQVAKAEEAVERAESDWQAAHLERRAMDTMVERIADQEDREAERRDQKAMDELVQQMRQRRPR